MPLPRFNTQKIKGLVVLLLAPKPKDHNKSMVLKIMAVALYNIVMEDECTLAKGSSNGVGSRHA
jgi:hypothetical protein